MGFAWNLILFSFVREREGYKHHADCTVHIKSVISTSAYHRQSKTRREKNNLNILHTTLIYTKY